MIKKFDKFLNEANTFGEHINEWFDNNLTSDMCAVAAGKDIIIFDLTSDSKVENEGGSYGDVDVEIAANIKEAKSTKVHTIEVQISYREIHGTDNWQGNLIFDGKSKKLDEDTCAYLCSPIFEQNIYWVDKSSELKDFAGELIADLIKGRHIKMS